MQYLEQGHRLLALHEKRPNNRYHARPEGSDEPGWSWERSIHGIPETDEDRAGVAAIFEDPTTTGIAILIPAGALVADIDTPEAAEIFMKAAPDWPPETCISRTPNGFHVWFLAPGFDSGVWLGGKNGLLFKGLGGYVAAPPSAHFNDDGVQDGVYEWARLTPTIATLPENIDRALATARALASPVRTGSDEDHDAEHIGWEWRDGRFLMWPEYRIDGLLKAVRESGEGNRNNMLAWAALTAAEEGVPFWHAQDALLQAALDAGLTRRESVTTIRAAFKRRRSG